MSTSPPEVTDLATLDTTRLALASARKALFAVTDIPDVRRLVAWAQGVEAAMAKLRHLHDDADRVRLEAAEVVLRAKRRMGELLATMERREQDDGRPTKCNSVLHLSTLADLGIERMEAVRCQRIAEVPEAVFEQVIADNVSAGKAPTQAAMLRLLPAADATVEVGQLPEAMVLMNRLFDWNRRFIRSYPEDRLDELRRAYRQLAQEVG